MMLAQSSSGLNNEKLDIEDIFKVMKKSFSSGHLLICFKHHLVPLEVLIAYCSCQVFDQNGDGLISGEELKLTMRSLGETLTEDEVIFLKTLPKAQRTRGLSSSYQSKFLRSYHKFKHKS